MKIEGGKLQRNGSFVVEVGPKKGLNRSGRAGGPRAWNRRSMYGWWRTGYALGGSRYTSVSHKTPTSPVTQMLRDLMQARAGKSWALVVDEVPARPLDESRRGTARARPRSESNILHPSRSGLHSGW